MVQLYQTPSDTLNLKEHCNGIGTQNLKEH